MTHHKQNKVYTCLIGITLFSVAMMIVMLGQRQFAKGDASASSASQSIIVTPMQLRNGMEIICLVDPENKTLSMYQYRLTGPMHERLALLASRSYKYDVMLEDFNTASPKPQEVKAILENARYIQEHEQVHAVAKKKVKAKKESEQRDALKNEAALEVQ